MTIKYSADNSRNQSNGHIPIFINSGNDEADLILFAGSPAVIAAVGDGIDSNGEADKDGPFINISDGSGVFALDFTLAQVCFAVSPLTLFTSARTEMCSRSSAVISRIRTRI